MINSKDVPFLLGGVGGPLLVGSPPMHTVGSPDPPGIAYVCYRYLHKNGRRAERIKYWREPVKI